MIRRLQAKFVGIMMGALLLVFAVVVATLNFFMQAHNAELTKDMLQTVAENDGIDFLKPQNMPGREKSPNMQRPEPPSQMMRSARIFYVKLDYSGNILDVQCDMMYGMTEDEAVSYVSAVLDTGRETGSYNDYQYLVAEKDYGKIAVFVENSRESQFLKHLIYVSLLVAGATCLLLLGFSLFLARWIAKPVKTTFEKQRQFVSDASHELKTPLTIILANADVLENEIGENIRLTQIREQSERMNRLVHDLLALARADEGNSHLTFSGFDLSKAVLSTLLSFECRAFEEEKIFDYDVQEGLRYTGAEPQIKQLCSILVDNAIKHSGTGGTIKVTLHRENDRNKLSVYNTGDGIPDQERERIFERFYRSDASRSIRTGGYGLGLAIAKSVVELHKGKISVTGKEGEWVRFTVVL